MISVIPMRWQGWARILAGRVCACRIVLSLADLQPGGYLAIDQP